jgi:hypothetical protein
VVRNTGTLLGGWLGGGGIEPAVELQRVAADDLSAEPFGELDRQTGLAGSRGTEDDEQLQTISPGRRMWRSRERSWYSLRVSRR